jgi:hypothetical protein
MEGSAPERGEINKLPAAQQSPLSLFHLLAVKGQSFAWQYESAVFFKLRTSAESR